MPWFFIQLRYMKPFLSAAPNHWAERRGRFASDIDFFLNRLLFQDFIRVNASGVRDLFAIASYDLLIRFIEHAKQACCLLHVLTHATFASCPTASTPGPQ